MLQCLLKPGNPLNLYFAKGGDATCPGLIQIIQILPRYDAPIPVKESGLSV